MYPICYLVFGFGRDRKGGVSSPPRFRCASIDFIDANARSLAGFAGLLLALDRGGTFAFASRTDTFLKFRFGNAATTHDRLLC